MEDQTQVTYASRDEKVRFFSLPTAYAMQMKKAEGYKWFKPLLALLLAVVISSVIQIIIELVFDVCTGALDGIDLTQAASDQNDSYLDFDINDPVQLIKNFLGAASVIPGVWLALKATGFGGIGRASSVEGHLRWDRILLYILPMLVIALLFNFGQPLIESVFMGKADAFGAMTFAPVAIIVAIVLCPLQCAAEEYMFRGLITQSLSSWIPIVVIPVFLQGILFASMHGYNLIGQLETLIMALVCTWLTLKTGGLEAAICIHTANNFSAFLVTSLFTSQTVQTNQTPAELAFSLVLYALMGIVCYVLARRKGLVIADR